MKQVKPFYMVVENRWMDKGSLHSLFYVRYVDPANWQPQEFPGEGGYQDPGEASQEFKKLAIGQRCGNPVSEIEFKHRIQQYQNDALKLQQWNACMKG